ncbi:unnamed protein product [Amoebophrya sp. A120]|nr:unnamed protein product [Amoebophrya sp. A120]|eukprot:GSA120T00002895001.1
MLKEARWADVVDVAEEGDRSDETLQKAASTQIDKIDVVIQTVSSTGVDLQNTVCSTSAGSSNPTASSTQEAVVPPPPPPIPPPGPATEHDTGSSVGPHTEEQERYRCVPSSSSTGGASAWEKRDDANTKANTTTSLNRNKSTARAQQLEQKNNHKNNCDSGYKNQRNFYQEQQYGDYYKTASFYYNRNFYGGSWGKNYTAPANTSAVGSSSASIGEQGKQNFSSNHFGTTPPGEHCQNHGGGRSAGAFLHQHASMRKSGNNKHHPPHAPPPPPPPPARMCEISAAAQEQAEGFNFMMEDLVQGGESCSSSLTMNTSGHDQGERHDQSYQPRNNGKVAVDYHSEIAQQHVIPQDREMIDRLALNLDIDVPNLWSTWYHRLSDTEKVHLLERRMRLLKDQSSLVSQHFFAQQHSRNDRSGAGPRAQYAATTIPSGERPHFPQIDYSSSYGMLTDSDCGWSDCTTMSMQHADRRLSTTSSANFVLNPHNLAGVVWLDGAAFFPEHPLSILLNQFCQGCGLRLKKFRTVQNLLRWMNKQKSCHSAGSSSSGRQALVEQQQENKGAQRGGNRRNSKTTRNNSSMQEPQLPHGRSSHNKGTKSNNLGKKGHQNSWLVSSGGKGGATSATSSNEAALSRGGNNKQQPAHVQQSYLACVHESMCAPVSDYIRTASLDGGHLTLCSLVVYKKEWRQRHSNNCGATAGTVSDVASEITLSRTTSKEDVAGTLGGALVASADPVAGMDWGSASRNSNIADKFSRNNPWNIEALATEIIEGCSANPSSNSTNPSNSTTIPESSPGASPDVLPSSPGEALTTQSVTSEQVLTCSSVGGPTTGGEGQHLNPPLPSSQEKGAALAPSVSSAKAGRRKNKKNNKQANLSRTSSAQPSVGEGGFFESEEQPILTLEDSFVDAMRELLLVKGNGPLEEHSKTSKKKQLRSSSPDDEGPVDTTSSLPTVKTQLLMVVDPLPVAEIEARLDQCFVSTCDFVSMPETEDAQPQDDTLNNAQYVDVEMRFKFGRRLRRNTVRVPAGTKRKFSQLVLHVVAFSDAQQCISYLVAKQKRTPSCSAGPASSKSADKAAQIRRPQKRVAWDWFDVFGERKNPRKGEHDSDSELVAVAQCADRNSQQFVALLNADFVQCLSAFMKGYSSNRGPVHRQHVYGRNELYEALKRQAGDSGEVVENDSFENVLEEIRLRLEDPYMARNRMEVDGMLLSCRSRSGLLSPAVSTCSAGSHQFHLTEQVTAVEPPEVATQHVAGNYFPQHSGASSAFQPLQTKNFALPPFPALALDTRSHSYSRQQPQLRPPTWEPTFPMMAMPSMASLASPTLPRVPEPPKPRSPVLQTSVLASHAKAAITGSTVAASSSSSSCKIAGTVPAQGAKPQAAPRAPNNLGLPTQTLGEQLPITTLLERASLSPRTSAEASSTKIAGAAPKGPEPVPCSKLVVGNCTASRSKSPPASPPLQQTTTSVRAKPSRLSISSPSTTTTGAAIGGPASCTSSATVSGANALAAANKIVQQPTPTFQKMMPSLSLNFSAKPTAAGSSTALAAQAGSSSATASSAGPGLSRISMRSQTLPCPGADSLPQEGAGSAGGTTEPTAGVASKLFATAVERAPSTGDGGSRPASISGVGHLSTTSAGVVTTSKLGTTSSTTGSCATSNIAGALSSCTGGAGAGQSATTCHSSKPFFSAGTPGVSTSTTVSSSTSASGTANSAGSASSNASSRGSKYQPERMQELLNSIHHMLQQHITLRQQHGKQSEELLRTVEESLAANQEHLARLLSSVQPTTSSSSSSGSRVVGSGAPTSGAPADAKWCTTGQAKFRTGSAWRRGWSLEKVVVPPEAADSESADEGHPSRARKRAAESRSVPPTSRSFNRAQSSDASTDEVFVPAGATSGVISSTAPTTEPTALPDRDRSAVLTGAATSMTCSTASRGASTSGGRLHFSGLHINPGKMFVEKAILEKRISGAPLLMQHKGSSSSTTGHLRSGLASKSKAFRSVFRPGVVLNLLEPIGEEH